MSKKQTDAALMSSLGGIFQKANEPKEVTPSPAPPEPAASPKIGASTLPAKSRGGKRSDTANYSQFTVYLKKDTPRLARRALEDAGSGLDFSELVQELVEKWLKEST